MGALGLIIFCIFLWFIYKDISVDLAGKNRNSALYLFAVWGTGIVLIGFFNAQVSGDLCVNEYIWIGAAILSKVASWVDLRAKFASGTVIADTVNGRRDFNR